MIALIAIAVLAPFVISALILIADDKEDIRRSRDNEWRAYLNGSRKGTAPDGLDDLGLK